MGVTGNLRTMTLPDLLQWVGVNRKTGTLELERAGCRRAVAFLDGHIVATALDDTTLLCHYLLSAGVVRLERLTEATERQRSTGENVVSILVADGWVPSYRIRETLEAQAEETVYGLFDWIDANFRFTDRAAPGPEYVAANLAVDEILLNGLQRLDEIKMIRKVFHTSGIVLAPTGEKPPPQVANSGMARRILGSIDGKRTLRDILVNAQASEFLVLKFLYHLYHKEVVRIHEVRPPEPGAMTLLDELPDDGAETAAESAATSARAPAPALAPAPAPRAEVAEATVRNLAELARKLSGGLDVRGPEISPRSQTHPAAATLAPARAATETEAARAGRVPTADAPAKAAPVERPEVAAVPEPAETAETTPAATPLGPHHVPVLLDLSAIEGLSQEMQFLVGLIDGQAPISQLLALLPFQDATVMGWLDELLTRGVIAIHTEPESDGPHPTP